MSEPGVMITHPIPVDKSHSKTHMSILYWHNKKSQKEHQSQYQDIMKVSTKWEPSNPFPLQLIHQEMTP